MTLFEERPVRPMLSKTGDAFDSDDYLFEVKWDGLRAILFLDGAKLELQNRNLRDVTTSYPEIQEIRKDIRVQKAILDGEVVVLSEKGTPDFGRLQTRFGVDDPGRVDAARRTSPATFVAFDLLHLNGKDLLKGPVEERKRILRSLLREGPHLLYGEHVERSGIQYYKEALKIGFEGIIAKERSSPYLPGIRSSSWVKIKGTRTVDRVVVGYTKGEGARASTFGSLVLAAYDKNGELVHVGNVGGGFSNATLESIRRQLDKLVRTTPVLQGAVEAPSPIIWVRPSIVCEVVYANTTSDRKLRFPRFRRLRLDKKASDCFLEEDILSA